MLCLIIARLLRMWTASLTQLTSQSHDVAASRRDLPLPLVTLYDPGLSDHRLLQWSVPVSRPDKPLVSVVRRPWHQLDVIALSDALRQSQHCRPGRRSNRSVYELALLYTIVNSRRCLTPWFQSRPSPVVDDRQIPGLSMNVVSTNVQLGDSNEWLVLVELRRGWRSVVYRSLLRKKAKSFWRWKVDHEKSSPRQLRCSIEVLLGVVVTHPVTTSTPNSLMITSTPRSPVFYPQLMVLRRRPSLRPRSMSI